jgi:hypothetical protein
MPRYTRGPALSVGLLAGLVACSGGTAAVDANRIDAVLPGSNGMGVQPTCTAMLAISGTYNPSIAPMTSTTGGGCQPAGGFSGTGSDGVDGSASATWTINVTTADAGNCTPVVDDAQYVYQVTQKIDGSNDSGAHGNTMVTYGATLGSGAGEYDTLTIGGDDDQCNAGFDMIIGIGTGSTMGTAQQWQEVSLHAHTAQFTSGFNDNLTGDGMYMLWPGSAYDFCEGSAGVCGSDHATD